jgi:nitroreductase
LPDKARPGAKKELAVSETVFTMPIEEAMRTQRAIRRLKSDPVDEALVMHLLELATRAPSGSNLQNWAFVVVRDRAVLGRLGRLNRQAWKIYSWIGRRLKGGDEKSMKLMKAGDHLAAHFEEIPVLVVGCLKGRVPPFPHVATASYFASIYPAVQNLLLGARAAGLGACLVTLPLWNVRAVKRALGLPGNVTPCALVPLGWPLGRYGPTTRRPLHEVVHLDRWGNHPAPSPVPDRA